jgi:Arc/MetJ-type ribon-helix-helix transcriptional regulator
MTSAKVAVTIDRELLRKVDAWVRAGEFPSRSRAIQAALASMEADRSRRHSLLAELAKLDPEEERRMADEWLVGEPEW